MFLAKAQMVRPVAAKTSILSAAKQLMSSDMLLPRQPHNVTSQDNSQSESRIVQNHQREKLLTDSDDPQPAHLDQAKIQTLNSY